VRIGRFFLVLALLTLEVSSSAQVFDVEKDREPMAVLNGLWRFHTGDDSRWADSGFDDSGWTMLRSNASWSTQGYKDYGGMAWYRFEVIVTDDHRPQALLMRRLMTSYQVFAGGRLIGQYGGLPPDPRADAGDRVQVFVIPSDVIVPGKPLQIAIRVWHWPRWAMFSGGGPAVASSIGDFDYLEAAKSSQVKTIFWNQFSQNVLLLIVLLAGLAVLALFALHPSDREYLWFGIFELLTAAGYAAAAYQNFYEHPVNLLETLQSCLETAESLFFLAFVFALLRQRRGVLYWLAIASALLHLVLWIPGELEWLSIPVWNGLLAIGQLPYAVAVLALLTLGARRGNRYAVLLLGPMGLFYVCILLQNAFWVYESAGHPEFRSQQVGWFYRVSAWPFPFSVEDVTDALVQLAVFAILVLRFARTRRDRQRLGTELEAARAVQSILMPEEIPAVPGFDIQCVYQPAGEVGGDFFQILLLPDKGALVAIGDVSGKGMPAALTVSLLVGALHIAAESTSSPAGILAALNRRLIGRSSGGFTSCLILRITSNESITVANAGHIAPYVNGTEVPTESGLPLGLIAEIPYADSAFKFGSEDRLTLITDGVLEARDSHGELFGFERTAAIANDSAHSIAEAAKTFGQEDDITVLTLTRKTIAEEHTSQVEPSGWSPAPA
jgi:sigma-B regulation protein RsbU (phosphoserine phosphatase)